jgi:hypothetical protein
VSVCLSEAYRPTYRNATLHRAYANLDLAGIGMLDDKKHGSAPCHVAAGGWTAHGGCFVGSALNYVTDMQSNRTSKGMGLLARLSVLYSILKQSLRHISDVCLRRRCPEVCVSIFGGYLSLDRARPCGLVGVGFWGYAQASLSLVSSVFCALGEVCSLVEVCFCAPWISSLVLTTGQQLDEKWPPTWINLDLGSFGSRSREKME